MRILELLRQRAGELARHLESADEDQLRRVAASIAQAVVHCSGLSHPDIAQALEYLTSRFRPNPELRNRIQTLAEQLDDAYFRLQEASEEGSASQTEVLAAFAKARAAAAVAAALGEIAMTAAAEAAYEAIAATDDPALFTAMSRLHGGAKSS